MPSASHQHHIKHVLLLVVIALACGCDSSLPPPNFDPTTVILVRHAEKAGHEADSPLTDEGKLRAEELAFMLADVRLEAVYSTPYKRTLETAKPVAEQHQLSVIEYSEKDARKFLTAVQNAHRGGTVLVVGHSNTIPGLANELTGTTDMSTLSGYDDLLIASFVKIGEATLLPLKYRREPPD
jgi:broad specificity phosphatase PhoE